MADRNVSLPTELGPAYYVESDQERDVTLGAVSYNETLVAAGGGGGATLLVGSLTLTGVGL